ncbi:YqeB family protein [Paenibacillus eucommiae]|uniref:50S ribosomal protein L29 n=1 Tax=Paenibacillus eucommiae TaxID=1355755 RepID=A0ABS4J5J0_9BACL|nr:50S ribosomal protein L29 [Paenibacillus eucommiae]MBP1994376.1 hypothetical protein [Paenibacillus eucommiae]
MGENKETILGLNKLEKTFIVVVPMILGAVIGWFIPVIAEGALKLPVVPMEKLLIFIASLNHFWVSIVASIIGAFVGLFCAFMVFSDSLKVTVSDNQLKLVVGDSEKIIEKRQISAVYFENKNLVVLGQRSHELCRAVLDMKLESVQEAFHQHRYPWKDEDPFVAQYQRWVLDAPNISSHIHAMLNVRERALKEDKKKEAKYLREDLAVLGVVIRDEKKSQYIRLITGIDSNAT